MMRPAPPRSRSSPRVAHPRWARRVVASACAVAVALGSLAAAAQTEPTPEQLRSAATEYEAGRRAFLARKYDEAAGHFESAFHDAPRAVALRNAIRARRDAKQLARAATLAALGERQYPDDVTTMVVVHDTLSAAGPRLHRVTLACTPECGVAADGQRVTLDDARASTFFLDPGPREVTITWPGDKTRVLKIRARAGRREEVAVDVPADAPPVDAAPPPAPAKVAEAPPAPVSTKPFAPGFFIIGVGLTAAGAAATTISAVAAHDESGSGGSTRTYVLLGATGGVALATAAIGVFFTQWSSPVQPTLAIGSDFRGAGLAGRF